MPVRTTYFVTLSLRFYSCFVSLFGLRIQGCPFAQQLVTSRSWIAQIESAAKLRKCTCMPEIYGTETRQSVVNNFQPSTMVASLHRERRLQVKRPVAHLRTCLHHPHDMLGISGSTVQRRPDERQCRKYNPSAAAESFFCAL
jgi:hypothetical protein